MKCPWRKKVEAEKPWPNKTIVYTDFMECYGDECPFYVPEADIDKNVKSCEQCKRAGMGGENEKILP